MQRLLRIEAPHFVAGAVFKKTPDWQCVEAAPIIKWMVGRDPQNIKAYLLLKNWHYEWINVNNH